MQDRRCLQCGGLVGVDASWCGLCFAVLPPWPADDDPADPAPGAKVGAEAPASAALAAGGAPVAVEEAPAPGRPVAGADPAWPCPACRTLTPIALDVCTSCGTPFARMFEEPNGSKGLAPRRAALLSLAFPGLGQWASGRPIDGLCRMVAFLIPLGTLLIMMLSRLGRGGLGSTATLVVLFALWVVFVWATAAVDAYRMASGARPLLAPKWLLWGMIGVLALGVGIASAVALPAIHKR